MSKWKITRQDVKNRYNKIVAIPYCDAQFLLKGKEASCYNSGLYGWNWDLYTVTVDGYTIAITTGYRNTIGRNCNHKLLKYYNELARKYQDKHFMQNWQKTVHHTNILLQRYLKKLFNI